MGNSEERNVDVLAEKYFQLAAKAEQANEELGRFRLQLIELVKRDGAVPPRATKTKALAGNEYELRVSQPLEVSVDTGVAERIGTKLRLHGCGELFQKLFRTVETYVLADGAEKLIGRKLLPKRAPRNLRALFARAVRVRELTPQLEVRKREKKEAAA